MGPTHSILFMTFACVLVSLSWADIVNRTTDDSLGDSATHLLVTYLPTTDEVWETEKCTTCSITPDISQTFSGTYTAATHMPGQPPISVTIDFTGIALWVFFTLANNVSGSVTQTAVNFTLDGGPSTFYNHNPDLSTTDFQYKVLVFQNDSLDSLDNIHHTLVISTSQFFPDPVYVNFDYAIYTHEDIVTTPSGNITASTPLDTTSSASPTTSLSVTTATPAPAINTSNVEGTAGPTKHAIIGGVLGGTAASLISLVAVYCCIRCRKRLARTADAATFLEEPTPYVDLPPSLDRFESPTIDARPRRRGVSIAHPLSKRALEERESINFLPRREQTSIPTSALSRIEDDVLHSVELISGGAPMDSISSNADDPRTEQPPHINQRMRDLRQDFNDLASELGESAHDMAAQLMSRRHDEHDHGEGEAINTAEMREQLLIIQAQIEDIEARQSFTSAGTGHQPSWIRPPEYTL